MVKVLIMLKNNINNINDDESFSLKKTMVNPHWSKWFEAMLSELNFHKENGTWDLIDDLSDCKVLTG